MGEAELEQLWQAQAVGPSVSDDTVRQVTRMRQQRTRIAQATFAAGLVAFVSLVLRVTALLAAPNFTLLNGAAELLLAALPFLGVVVVALQLRRRHLELDALRLDTRSCVAFAHRAVRREIREIQTIAPPMLGVFLALFAVAKWQSIAVGRETLAHEVFSIVLVLAVAGAIAAVLYHRLVGFLRPRLAYLEQIQDSLGA